MGASSVTSTYSASKNKSALPLLVVIAVVFLSANTVAAVDSSLHISQYGHSAWRIQDGFFRAQPNVITQTSDGYIWVGTDAGLFRFDGVRVVPWTPPDGSHLLSAKIISLLASRDGSLWIGTDAGLSHWVGGRLKSRGVSMLSSKIGARESGSCVRIPLTPVTVLSVRLSAQQPSAIEFLPGPR